MRKDNLAREEIKSQNKFILENLKGEHLWINIKWLKMAHEILMNGKALQIPRMYQIRLKQGKAFIEKDDLDGTQRSWSPPFFLLGKNPSGQKEKVSVSEIDLESIGVDLNPNNKWRFPTFAKVIQNILTPEECADLIHSVNEKGNMFCYENTPKNNFMKS